MTGSTGFGPAQAINLSQIREHGPVPVSKASVHAPCNNDEISRLPRPSNPPIVLGAHGVGHLREFVRVGRTVRE
jgi:hypothetical protein